MNTADYIATTGTTIVLAAGVNVGAIVEVIAWTVSSLGVTGPTGPTSTISITDDTSTNATRYIHFGSTTTGAMTSVNTSSTNLYFNPNSGNLTVGGAVTAYSDIRLKQDVGNITNSLATLLQLQGVTYTRKDTGVKGRGFIAQEMAAVYPENVVVNPQDGMMSVAYTNLLADIVEAIRELNNKIDALGKG